MCRVVGITQLSKKPCFAALIVLLTTVLFRNVTSKAAGTCLHEVTCASQCGERVVVCSRWKMDDGCSVVSCKNGVITFQDHDLCHLNDLIISRLKVDGDTTSVEFAAKNCHWSINSLSGIQLSGRRLKTITLRTVNFYSPQGSRAMLSAPSLTIEDSILNGFPFEIPKNSLSSVLLKDNRLNTFPRDFLPALDLTNFESFKLLESTPVKYFLNVQELEILSTITKNNADKVLLPRSTSCRPGEGTAANISATVSDIDENTSPESSVVTVCLANDDGDGWDTPVVTKPSSNSPSTPKDPTPQEPDPSTSPSKPGSGSDKPTAQDNGGNSQGKQTEAPTTTPTTAPTTAPTTTPTKNPSTTSPNPQTSSQPEVKNSGSTDTKHSSVSSSKSTTTTIIITVLATFVAVLVLVIVVYFVRKRKNRLFSSSQQNDSKTITVLETNTNMDAIDPPRSPPLSTSAVDAVDATFVRYERTYTSYISSSSIRVLRKIGTGFYGQVFLAELSGEYVAVKKQNFSSAQHFDPPNLQQEINVLKRLNHPNVIKYRGMTRLEFEGSDGAPELCIVCEYMPNGDLRAALKTLSDLILPADSSVTDSAISTTNEPAFSTVGAMQSAYTNSSANAGTKAPFCSNKQTLTDILERFTWEELKLQITIDILQGLDYLHGLKQKIVHRDLKSPNVLLDDTFTAKLSDFGTSREVSLSYTMTAIGSTLWMAPEVLSGVKFDEKADMFSFGVVLSEIITLQLPYSELTKKTGQQGLHPMAIALQVANEGLRPNIESPSSIAPPPPFIKQLFEICMHQDPSQRPTTRHALEFIYPNIQAKPRMVVVK